MKFIFAEPFLHIFWDRLLSPTFSETHQDSQNSKDIGSYKVCDYNPHNQPYPFRIAGF